MSLNFDRETGYLWAGCDNHCANVENVFVIDTDKFSFTFGKFTRLTKLDKPNSMASENIEGFTTAPESSCVNGQKKCFWANDNDTNGYSIL